MVNVGIAGGTSGIGLAIVKAIVAAGNHNVTIFSRSAGSPAPTGAEVLGVDYTSVEALVTTLEEHQVHTVIVASSINDPDGLWAQLNLIEAAEKSPCTKRFIPSGFGTHYDRDVLKYQPRRLGTVEAQERLDQSPLEHTFFTNGIFLDFYTTPGIPSDLTKIAPVFVDMAGNAASIPGNGTAMIVATHSRDIGKAVARLLNESDWPKRSILIGDRLSCNDLVKLAEETKGVEFTKVFQTTEMMEAGDYTLTPGLQNLPPQLDVAAVKKALASTALITTKGQLDLGEEGTLNQRWPDWKPMTVKEGMTEAWK